MDSLLCKDSLRSEVRNADRPIDTVWLCGANRSYCRVLISGGGAQDFPGTEWADKGRGFGCRSYPPLRSRTSFGVRFARAEALGPRGVRGMT